MQIVSLSWLHLLHCSLKTKLGLLKGIIIEENLNKFMTPVGPSGLRTLEMHTRALEIKRQMASKNRIN